jgi:hypothetical protein
MTVPTIEELDAILSSRRGWRIRIEWKLRYLWIGAYWTRIGNCIDLWVCLIPCVPFHVLWWWSTEPIRD